MLCFAELNGKKVKKFTAKHIDSIYTQFNNYCAKRIPNAKYILDNNVLGKLYWSDGKNSIKLVKDNN